MKDQLCIACADLSISNACAFSMDDRYTTVDDEAVEGARQKMSVFQTRRGLISAIDPAKRIAELRAEIRRLQDSIPRSNTGHGRRHPAVLLIAPNQRYCGSSKVGPLR